MDHQRYIPVPTFDYSSAFSYRSVLSEFDTPEDTLNIGAARAKSTDTFQQIAYYLLTGLSFLFFLCTVPISSFFCVKRVNALQRCLTYRLGNRLPLKGPGLILKLPFIDHISIIDLYDERFSIFEKEEQILTSDGSIILLRPCWATLNVTNAVLTTLKIGEVDVKECLRLRFANTIRSKHVEDLENKIDFVMKQFEENCGKFLQRWGYAFKLEEMPRFTVVERADPLNPIKNKLTKLLSPDANNPSSPAEALLNMLSPLMPKMPLGNSSAPARAQQEQGNATEMSKDLQLGSASPLTDEEVRSAIPVIESFIEQYSAFLTGYDYLTLEFIIDHNAGVESPEKRRHHYFQYSDGSIKSLSIAPPQARMTVRFESYANFERFLVSSDTKYLQYCFN